MDKSTQKFKVYITSNIEHNKKQFIFSFFQSSYWYWRLDCDKYYTVTLYGVGYSIRYSKGRTYNDLVKELKENGIMEKNEESISYEHIIKYDKYTNLRTDIFNKYLLKIIRGVYDYNKDIYFYNSNMVGITFAIKNTVRLDSVLNRLNTVLKESDLKWCFDNVEVKTFKHDTYSIDYTGIGESDLKLSIEYLDNVVNNYNIDGCDEPQVIEYFKKIEGITWKKQ